MIKHFHGDTIIFVKYFKKWGIFMSINVKVLNHLEYITVLNQVTNRLVVFEKVFSEYVKTAKHIITGRALVDENLPSLQKRFYKNLQVLKHFSRLVIEIPVENDCLELKKNLNNAFQQYISTTIDLYRVINQDNLENYQTIMSYRKNQKFQAVQISQVISSGAELSQDKAI